jgi:hypothetical protein
MQFRTMNIDALTKAAELAVGKEGAEVIAKLYETINAAMQTAYNEGHLAGFFEGEEESAMLYEEAHEAGRYEGYAEGYEDGVEDEQNATLLDDMAADQEAFFAALDSYDEAPSDGAIYAAISARDASK